MGRRKMIRRSGRDDEDDLGMCDGEEKKGVSGQERLC